MGSAVKKSTTYDQNYYEAQFSTIKNAASAFEHHESETESLLHVALDQIFQFGESIRQDAQAFESFLSVHGKTCNKVTKTNPYNALVDLAFSNRRSKSWRSQMSNVLALAAETIGDQQFVDWLVSNSGVSGCYNLAVDHFERPATAKAKKLRSIRLNTISEQLKRKPIVKTALPGVSLPNGFHRSMLFSQGGQTFLVDIREGDNDATIEKYLLEAMGDKAVATNPHVNKPLFSLYRAIDLICGTCKPSSTGQLQCIAVWNEEAESGAVTKLRFLSEAYSFTNATVTLAHTLSELNGKGQLILDLPDADIFRQQFQQDPEWTIREDNRGLVLADNAKSPARLRLLPASDYADKKLRQGRKLGLRTRHFTMSLDAMQRDNKNLDIAMTLFQKANTQRTTPISRPKRFQWVFNGKHIELGFEQTSGMINTNYPSIAFKATATTVPHNELLLADAQAVWNSFLSYGEDIGGYIAHGEVADAAFCIDHAFVNGDIIEYRSPLIIGRKTDPTQICEPFVPVTAPTPTTPQTPTQRSKSSTRPGKRSGPVQSIVKKAASAPASTAASVKATRNPRPRNYRLIENNRRAKTMFPAIPVSSEKAFGAFITSYLPDEAEHRKNRKFDFEWQLEWWRRMTDIPIHVIASNWTDEDVTASKELGLLTGHGGSIIRQPAQSIAQNRNLCLSELYASDFDWGIVMDDDAVLMQAENHNSSYRLFAEMAANGKSAYDGVDLFQPIFGRQVPFNKKYSAANNPYADNHVFERSTNLKGTMIVVRNFVKEDREPLFLPEEFGFVGEDTYLTLQAISKGFAPMTCWNLILEELGGESHFAMSDAERAEKMREGHEKLVELFGQDGLKMSGDGSHKLDKGDFTAKFWGVKKQTVTVSKRSRQTP
ncbi:hypothetical protein [Rhizobium sp. SYY.PMSO]|uniref:hypothetical protein n=1 Tax=Rhizobium sp. SYY.PMSO TaxID=3382192 RepID=UPI00398FC196